MKISSRHMLRLAVTNSILVLAGCASLDSKNPATRMKALQSIYDQPTIAQVALKDPDSRVRRIAVEKLQDQESISRVALGDVAPAIRRTAADKLTNQQILAQIATQDQVLDVRLAAVARLTDQAVLARLAEKDSAKEVRVTAVAKLNDETLLAKIACEDKEEDVRKAAHGRLTDQDLRQKVALWSVDRVKQITGPAMLARIATRAGDPEVRKAAARQLMDRADDAEPLVAYEWLALEYLRQGQIDDAVLAMLMNVVRYDQAEGDHSSLSLELFERALALRQTAAAKAGLASLVGTETERQSIQIQELTKAVNEASEAPLRVRDPILLADAITYFRENLTPKEPEKGEEAVKYLSGDIPFVSALGLLMLQHPEDWPFIERSLAAYPYANRMFPCLRALAKANPELETLLMTHPSGFVRANALLALSRPAAESETDALVRMAGAHNPPDGAKDAAIGLLKEGLTDDRHVVRTLAMRGLMQHEVSVSRGDVEKALTVTDSWKEKYFADGSLFATLAKAMSSIGKGSLVDVDSDPSNSTLSQIGYRLLAQQPELSSKDFVWLLERMRDHLLVIPKTPWNQCASVFSVGSVGGGEKRSLDAETIRQACIAGGYPVEENWVVRETGINEELSELIGKHACKHVPELLSAARKASPYVRMFLVQAATKAAADPAVRAELWRIAETKALASDEKDYRKGLGDEVLKRYSGGMVRLNYTAINEAADALVSGIHKQNRSIAASALCKDASPDEIARLTQLLSDGEVARALVPGFLGYGKDVIAQQINAKLLHHANKEVQLSAAILRLCAEDEPDARNALKCAVLDNDDALAFTARVALATNAPALMDVVQASGKESSPTLAGHLTRRVISQRRLIAQDQASRQAAEKE